jgi:integrase
LVFRGVDGGPLDLNNTATVVRRHLQQAGVARARLYATGTNMLRFGTHSFRHSFTTRSLALGKTDD